jgi:UPF0716 protein FxsA
VLAILILLFTVIPAVEIGLFVVIGGRIGPWATVAVVLFTGVAGASLARYQGLRVLQQIQDALGRGAMPTDELVEGALVLFGGALLLTPGFLTDAWGLSCLFPVTRKALAVLVKRGFARRVKRTGPGGAEMGGWQMWTGGVQPGPAAQEKRIDLGEDEPPAARGPRTIDASFQVVDEEEG